MHGRVKKIGLIVSFFHKGFFSIYFLSDLEEEITSRNLGRAEKREEKREEGSINHATTKITEDVSSAQYIFIMEENLKISIGPRTGRVYVRNPSLCSKISGVNYQCQQKPAPGSKFCHHHIEMNKRARNKATKSHIDRKNCGKYKGKSKDEFKRSEASEWALYAYDPKSSQDARDQEIFLADQMVSTEALLNEIFDINGQVSSQDIFVADQMVITKAILNEKFDMDNQGTSVHPTCMFSPLPPYFMTTSSTQVDFGPSTLIPDSQDVGIRYSSWCSCHNEAWCFCNNSTFDLFDKGGALGNFREHEK
ncbi:hypothetical protein SUGI_0765560 [Cryptomeria japonica]|nr:hypothetical protein SUGI_0765560 [Cryptomeria japonica]